MKNRTVLLLIILSLAGLFLIACPTSDEPGQVLSMKIDKDNDSLLTFDSLIVTVHSKDGTFSQDVFHGVLRNAGQVASMPLDARVGKEYTVSIVGFRGGKIAVNKEVTFIGSGAQSKDLPIQKDKPETTKIDPKIPELLASDTAILEGDSLRLLVNLRNPWELATLSLKDAPTGAVLDTVGLGSIGTAYFTWRPTFAQGRSEAYSIALVYASASLKVEKPIRVKVQNVNRAPKLARLANVAKNENELLEVQVTASDPDGDSLTLSVDSLPTNAVFAKGLFSWKPGIADVGNHTLTFRASDGFASDSQTIILSIGAVNRPPEILGLSDTTVKEYDSLSMVITTKDPEGKPVVLKATGLPDSAKFTVTTSGNGRLTWKVKGNQSRTEPYAISFSANDGELEAKATLHITVLDVPKKMTVAITAPLPDAITNQKTIQVQWNVNGVAQPTTTETLKIEGANSITRSYDDGEGNTGSNTVTIYRDTLPPLKPTLSASAYAKGLPAVSWQLVEPGITYEYRFVLTGTVTPVSKGSTAGLVFPPNGTSAPTVSSGEYWFYVKSTDRAGNISAEAGQRILIDMISPSLAITGPTELARTTSLDPVITGNAADNLGLKSLTYTIQDSAPKAITLDKGKWSLTGLKFSEGPNKVVITAKDSADRDSSATITITKLSKVVFVREGATGNGTSWDDALPDMDIALNAAYRAKYLSGTQIWATSGNYPRGTEYSLYLKSDLTLVGGFSKSHPQSSASARDSVDGRSYFYTKGPVTDLFNVADYDQVTTLQKQIQNVTIDGFDFMSTDANGIMIPGATNVLFKNCRFKDAPNGMVIVSIDTSSVEFQDCSFTNNKTSRPVVITNKTQSVSFNRCNFLDNTSNAAGAIQVLSGNVLVQNSYFKNNNIKVWVMDDEVTVLRHVSVAFSTSTVSMKNCTIQGLKANPSSITTDDGSPFAVDASNKDFN